MRFSEALPLPRSGPFELSAATPSRRARALRIEAERCFRLAQGIGSFELAEELEALGRAFEAEAEELAVGRQPPAAHRELATAV